MSDRVDKGLRALLDRAIDLDKRGMSKEACHYYLRASKILLKCSKSASLPSTRKFYFDRAQECVDRVYVLSGIKRTTRSKATSSSHAKTTSETRMPRPLPRTDEDEEKKRSDDGDDDDQFQSMLEGTVVREKPDVRMSDVIGLEEAKQAIYDALIMPMKHPELFRGRTRQPWRGILFYGPAGCGKTLIAKAVAAETNATFFNVSSATLVSKWFGESERLVKTLFEMARANQPSIVFIDELDSIGASRSGYDIGAERRLKTQMLTEIQGVTSRNNERVTVIGATNLPWHLDIALVSRFEKKILIPLPSRDSRRAIFQYHMEDIEVAPNVDFDELADLTEGYSGRDISVVCRDAAMEPIRDLQRSGTADREVVDVRPVDREDFLLAIQKVRPATSPDILRKYMDWAESGQQ
ncbi:MAG: AAA family ATPase [Candidatus Thorarchaeota archaeon]